MKVLITNIQRFCLNDGPGIRTTVFFKGCNLRCPWCSNPENLEFIVQEYIDENGNNQKLGYEITTEELEAELLKDEKYYATGGGVTFSGGECLLQFKQLEPLLKSLKEKNINMCVETSLVVSKNLIEIALKYIDEFYVDIKILDKQSESLINSNSEIYLENLKTIFDNNSRVIYRFPVVPEYTYTDNNIKKLMDLLRRFKPLKIELFRVHNLGDKKYKSLNLPITKFKQVEDEDIENLMNMVQELGIDVELIKI